MENRILDEALEGIVPKKLNGYDASEGEFLKMLRTVNREMKGGKKGDE